MRPTRQTVVLAAVCWSLANGAPLAAQAPTEAMRVFMDCQTFCDFDHTRREITYVNWVRDRQDADVHLLITSQGTGGGGREYSLQYIGLRAFQGVTDEIKFTTLQSDTDDDVRKVMTQRIGLGLARYVARGSFASRVKVTFEAPAGATGGTEQKPKDPWNLWVFRLGVNGSFSGESQSSRNSISGNFRASRISDAWKVQISGGANHSHSRFTLSDSTEYTTDRDRYNASTLLVRSLGDHWSVGFEQSAIRSTFDNYDFKLEMSPGVEFDVFPYKESSKRQMVFVYSVGVTHSNYGDTTLYNKVVETRPFHKFILAAQAVQPWGSLNAQITLSSLLDDFGFNRASIDGGCDIRLLRGLNLNLFGSYARVRDQLSLPRAGATNEEILLQLKQLKTSYFYFGAVGLSYTFGSKFNNVVNPRFSNSGGGGNCFCSGGSCFCS